MTIVLKYLFLHDRELCVEHFQADAGWDALVMTIGYDREPPLKAHASRPATIPNSDICARIAFDSWVR